MRLASRVCANRVSLARHRCASTRATRKRCMVSTSSVRSAPPSPLLVAVRQQLRLVHYSERTAQSYIAWIVRYIRFHGTRHPAELGREHVMEFLSALAIRSNVSASTQNQALAGISFLYRDVLKIPLEDVEEIVRAKRPVRLPVVLTREEVKRVMGELEETPRLVAMLL
jgi:site-specific recombinase XerD